MTRLGQERDRFRLIAAGICLALLLMTSGTLNAAPYEEQLLNIGNVGAVDNNPSRPSVFYLDAPYVITYLYTYHWNYGRGTGPGVIGLRNDRGEVFGPYPAAGSPGQGGVPNAVWEVRVAIKVPPGRYTIIDSEPATWAWNGESSGMGFAIVRGYRNY